MQDKICVDAAVCAALFIPEAGTEACQRLFAAWVDRQAELIAPDLWAYEVVAVVHKCFRQNWLSQHDAAKTLQRLLVLPVRLVRPVECHMLALQSAADHRLPAAYDAHYLVVAEMEAAEFWTLDERLYNTVHPHLAWVHWVGELATTTGN